MPLQSNQAKQQGALLAMLFRGEDAVRRRCAIVASRLELARSAMVLLEVACHADASLDDLGRFAGNRGVVLETLATRVRSWGAAVLNWAAHVWAESVIRDYRAVLDDMRRNLSLVDSLRVTCAQCGDRHMADWCALWVEQRLDLAARLEASLEEPANDTVATLSSLPVTDEARPACAQ